jgi:hypothetical protein
VQEPQNAQNVESQAAESGFIPRESNGAARPLPPLRIRVAVEFAKPVDEEPDTATNGVADVAPIIPERTLPQDFGLPTAQTWEQEAFASLQAPEYSVTTLSQLSGVDENMTAQSELDRAKVSVPASSVNENTSQIESATPDEPVSIFRDPATPSITNDVTMPFVPAQSQNENTGWNSPAPDAVIKPLYPAFRAIGDTEVEDAPMFSAFVPPVIPQIDDSDVSVEEENAEEESAKIEDDDDYTFDAETEIEVDEAYAPSALKLIQHAMAPSLNYGEPLAVEESLKAAAIVEETVTPVAVFEEPPSPVAIFEEPAPTPAPAAIFEAPPIPAMVEEAPMAALTVERPLAPAEIIDEPAPTPAPAAMLEAPPMPAMVEAPPMPAMVEEVPMPVAIFEEPPTAVAVAEAVPMAALTVERPPTPAEIIDEPAPTPAPAAMLEAPPMPAMVEAPPMPVEVADETPIAAITVERPPAPAEIIEVPAPTPAPAALLATPPIPVAMLEEPSMPVAVVEAPPTPAPAKMIVEPAPAPAPAAIVEQTPFPPTAVQTTEIAEPEIASPTDELDFAELESVSAPTAAETMTETVVTAENVPDIERLAPYMEFAPPAMQAAMAEAKNATPISEENELAQEASVASAEIPAAAEVAPEPEAAPAPKHHDALSSLPPFDAVLGMRRKESHDASEGDFEAPVHKLEGLRLSFMKKFMPASMPHLSVPHMEMPHVEAPPMLAALVERIPAKLRMVVVGVIAVLIAGVIFVVFHALHHSAPATTPVSAGAAKTVTTQGAAKTPAATTTTKAANQATAPPTAVPHKMTPPRAQPKHHLDATSDGEAVIGAPQTENLTKQELAKLKTSVPQTCSVHGEKVMKWNFFDGYLLCVVHLKSGTGTYVLERDGVGFTYLGGLTEAPSPDGIAELGVPTATANKLVSHYTNI